jgi:steroid delta-isomerase-like uncharacterized protein
LTRPQEIMRRAREAFNAHDEERLRSFCSEDVVFEAPGDIHLEGAEATIDYAMNWLRAFPDARMQAETEVVQGEWAVQRFVFEGSHRASLEGPGGKIPATGKKLIGRGVQVSRISDDAITEEYLYFDQMQVLSQLGLVSELVASR